MKRLNKRQRIPFVFLWLGAVIFSCSKQTAFVETDPATGLPPVALTTAGGECSLIQITQKNNGNSPDPDNVFDIKRDSARVPKSISLYDSLSKKSKYALQLQFTGDTIRSSTGEFFILNKVSRQVEFFYTWSDLSDPGADLYIYQYLYDGSGYLVKKYLYVNGSVTPSYETNYTYDAHKLLSGCTLYAGSKKDKLLESAIEYDMTSERKPWIYLFPDFFEGPHYLQALAFGKRGNYPVSRIATNIYDVQKGTVLDTWLSTFDGYVFSTDGFILQTTCKGSFQQGIGLIYGITRFDYKCSK